MSITVTIGIDFGADRDAADADPATGEPSEATDAEVREIFADESPSGETAREVEAIGQ